MPAGKENSIQLSDNEQTQGQRAYRKGALDVFDYRDRGAADSALYVTREVSNEQMKYIDIR